MEKKISKSIGKLKSKSPPKKSSKSTEAKRMSSVKSKCEEIAVDFKGKNLLEICIQIDFKRKAKFSQYTADQIWYIICPETIAHTNTLKRAERLSYFNNHDKFKGCKEMKKAMLNKIYDEFGIERNYNFVGSTSSKSKRGKSKKKADFREQSEQISEAMEKSMQQL